MTTTSTLMESNMACKYEMMTEINLWIHFYLLVILVSQPVICAIEKDKNVVSSNSSLSSVSYAYSQNRSQCLQILCSESKYDCFGIQYSQNGPTLPYGHCVTYSEDTNLLSMSSCRYFEPENYNVTSSQHNILLPRNLSQLNDYMCGPMNRKGLVCSECADGFGSSVTSFGYKCANCTDAWYGVPLFLFLEFVPITVFYVLVLTFQISITSPPMPCLIMYSQLIVIAFDSTSFVISRDMTLDLKIVLTLYCLFNLDFCRYDLLPPFCVSSRLKSIHTFFLGYISAFYPILLICLTWVCVELHGRNFRPLVWLWRPFHRCFVHLRRGWDTKSDIIDVFTTFFFLSYTKIIYQTLLLLSNEFVRQRDEFGRTSIIYRSAIDVSIDYRGVYYLSFAIPTGIIASIFFFLPPLLLILFSIKAFRLCLLKCHLNFIAMQIFIDKVHSCYRNGLDGDRDMRSFSGLYFFLRAAVYLTSSFSHLLTSYNISIDRRFAVGTLFFLITLTIAIARPYRKAYMNYLDTAILFHLAILCYMLSSNVGALLLKKILLAIPIAVFILTTILRKSFSVSKVYCKILKICKYCSNNCFRSRSTPSSPEPIESPTVDNQTASQPLTLPTSTIISYGTCKDNYIS